jgi:hypothetical protein
MERLARAKRHMAMCTAVTAVVALGPGVALAEPAAPQRGWGGSRQGGQSGPGLTVEGRALSQAGDEVWTMDIRGRSGAQAADAGGFVRFGHRAPDGASDGLSGQIHCLSKDDAGVIQVTGTVQRSGSRPAEGGQDQPDEPGQPGQPSDPGQLLDAVTGALGGDHRHHGHDDGTQGESGPLDGKDFAFTIDVPGDPQRFSLPKLGDAGTLSACSAGASDLKPVTRGGFRSTETQGQGG